MNTTRQHSREKRRDRLKSDLKFKDETVEY